MVYEIKQTEKAATLFADWRETLIWSCLQQVMGHIYVNFAEAPISAMAVLGDFCFFAGKPDKEIVLYKPDHCKQDVMIMIPQNELWAEMIEMCYGNRAKRVIRYAMKKEKDIFDKNQLQKAVDALPVGYEMQMIDEELFYRCRKIAWCRDWVSQYLDYERYQERGLGAIILKNGEPVSGASSYSGYRNGIEIEIDTRKDYRRKGLAYISGAKLILECLKRGWYPSWDAQNQWSVALAEKLGYHYDSEYVAYETELF